VKTFVNFLAASVRKAPWIVVAVTIVVTMVLGTFAGNFTPAEDQNESFAPDAPELTAATDIGEKFGTTVARMQVLTSSTTGDVITLEGLQASIALDESVRSGAGAEYLVDSDQQPAVLSYLAPVQFAIAAGAPMPTNDAEVKALYTQGLLSSPPEFRSFLTALVSEDANLEAGTATYGLTSVAYGTDADFDEAAARATAIAESVVAAPTPVTITQDPFSQELIFASGDDFQDEILRMFAAAGLIILLVLAIVFLVKPSTFKDRALFYVGIALMLAGVLVAIAPSLGLIFPDVFPESWGDAELAPVLLTAAIFFAAAFILWTLSSRKLRRTTADTLLTFLTIGFAIQWANGFGNILFDDASQLAQILPILLIGLGVDYAIHFQTRYRQELASGRTVDLSIATAIRTVGIALVLATLTTAVGFLTNVTSSIPAIFEFGVLAAIGITASFLLTMTFVPAVRELLDRRGEKNDRLDTDGLGGGDSRLIPRVIGSFSVLPRRFAVATVIVFFIGTGFAAFAMTGLSTQFSFLDFVPTTSPIRTTAVTITDNFEFPETTSVLVEGDISTGAAWNSMLDSYTNAADVENVQSIELEGGTKFATGQSLMSVMFQFLNPGAETFDSEMFDVAISIGFNQQRKVPEGSDVTPLYDIAYQNHPESMIGVLSASPDGGYDAALFNFDTTAGENGAGQISDDLNAAFDPVRSAGLAAVTTSSFIISDLVVVTLRDSQVSSLALTLTAALLLLVINFWFESRRPMLGVITTLPVAMVVIWVFGFMAVVGIAFGPVTSMVSAIGIGIGIPYMIHVTQRYLEERVTQDDPDSAIRETLETTGGALGGSALTTMAGFGILMLSTTIPFRQFGFVLAYTIFLALMAAVALLPSMLVLWDRWHRRRGDAVLDADAVHAALQDQT